MQSNRLGRIPSNSELAYLNILENLFPLKYLYATIHNFVNSFIVQAQAVTIS